MNYGDSRERGRKLIYLFVTLAEVLLAFRFVISLLDADYTNAFIRWVYSTTDVLLLPFRSVFPDVDYSSVHVLEFPVLFAMVAYGFIGYVVVSILFWLPQPPAAKKKK